jgi:ATPase subunit of ABC transporter with duplicated ATPase domains
MRLRYLRIRQRPPFEDTEVTFGREEILGLTGSIHFVIGINGTGKSKMLQTLTETLLTLEKRQNPRFPGDTGLRFGIFWQLCAYYLAASSG